jgi:hypothetical protein
MLTQEATTQLQSASSLPCAHSRVPSGSSQRPFCLGHVVVSGTSVQPVAATSPIMPATHLVFGPQGTLLVGSHGPRQVLIVLVPLLRAATTQRPPA